MMYLDLHSLTRLSGVSTYLQFVFKRSKTTKLFKDACMEIWNREFYKGTPTFLKNFINWREMFFDRPRLSFRGIYVAEMFYMRKGMAEAGWCNPVHKVIYYMYLGFREDGSLM